MTETPRDRTRIRIEQQLGGVVTQSLVRRVAAVDPVPVPLAGSDVGDVPMPHQVGALHERMGRHLSAALIEEHEVDGLSALREDREVGPRAIPCRPERRVGSWPGSTAPGRASGSGKLWDSHGSTLLDDLGLPV